MVVDTKLLELANIFKEKATLYAVGGFVRDNLLNIKSSDIDVCSSLKPNEVRELLKDSPFVVLERNLRMGTLIIVNDGFSVEYTTFRVDSYNKESGNHSPLDVSFTENIEEDARRRDFKCNAVYYDIANDKIVDIIGGVDDIKNKIVSTADEPDVVFEADGLRILRLVRFAAELGFNIEKETFISAKNNAWRVKDIAVERIHEELNKIFVADTKHKDLNLLDAHVRGIELLDELGLLKLLLPEVDALKGLEQPKKYHLYDAYIHSIMAFKASTPSIRWAVLCHDIGKRPCMDANGNMHGHEKVGADIAVDIANRFKFSNDEKKKFLFLIRNHMVDLEEKTGMGKLRRFVATNFESMEDLVQIKRADCIGACGEVRQFRIEKVIEKVKSDGTPLSIKELKVNGKDLIDLNVPEIKRGEILNELWIDTILNPSLNNRNDAIKYLKRKVDRLR